MDISYGASEQNHVDELVEQVASFSLENHDAVQVRTINLILDHSAFVRGIGNIKRWFNPGYIRSSMVNADEKIQLNIYIPSYTLHEFDFVKKGTSMMATNAREAIRFIDRIFERDDIILNGSQNNANDNPIRYGIFIESPRESGPSWNECLNYKVHSPKVREFPNFKTKFDSNLIGQQVIPDDQYDGFTSHFKSNAKLNDIQYENSPSYQNAIANSDNEAEMPIRLRYLIRSCIYKRYIDTHNPNKPQSSFEDWKLVTEDPITKVWVKSFGIDCLNVNDAELLIFKNYDVNQFNTTPHSHFSLDEGYDNSKNILQNTIDTTRYSYTTAKPTNRHKPNTSKQPRRKNRTKVNGVVSEGFTSVNGEYIKKERFDAINYAPRGSGELWKP